MSIVRIDSLAMFDIKILLMIGDVKWIFSLYYFFVLVIDNTMKESISMKNLKHSISGSYARPG